MAAAVPWAYLGVALVFSKGLRKQVGVVRARTPKSFLAAVERAGGPDSVAKGLWFDGVFILTFLLVYCGLLASVFGWWVLLPAAAGCLDIGEAVILWPMLGTTPTARRTRLLAVVADLKVACYLAAVAVLVVACLRQ